MSKQVQIRRDTASNLNSTVPALGELGVDTTNKRLRIGDGSTAGGTVVPNAKDTQNNTFSYVAASGTDTITLTLTPAATAYTAGMIVKFVAAGANTTAVTLNVNSLGAKNLYKRASGVLSALSAGDLISGGAYTAMYDGTQFQLISEIGNAGSLTLVSSTTISGSPSTVDFPDIFTSGNNYIIDLAQIRSADNAHLYMLIAASGSSWITTNYKHRSFGVGSAGTLSTASSESDAQFQLSPLQGDSLADGYHGQIHVLNPQGGTRAFKMHGQLAYREVGNAHCTALFSGEYGGGTTAMGSFRIDLQGASTFSDGKISVYEYPNA